MIKSYKDFVVLSILKIQPMHGYDLLGQSNKILEIKKITLYKTLDRLEQNSMIEIKEIINRRKIYQLTPKGIEELNSKSNVYPKVQIIEYTSIGKESKHFDSIDSTNKYLKENSEKLCDGYVVTTDFQTQGRGRLNRVWQSKPNQNLMMSILIKPDVMIHEIPKLTQVAAASVHQALKEFDINTKIKWPNDILIKGKKVAGILVESKLEGDQIEAIIIGLGLNVNSLDFDEEINNKATSLRLSKDKEFDIYQVKDKILNNMEKYYNEFLQGKTNYLDICRKESHIIGNNVTVSINNKELLVKVVDISQDGQLLVEMSGEIVALNISEVTLEKNY